MAFYAQKAQGQNCSVNAGLSKTVCASSKLILEGEQTGNIGTDAEWKQIAGPKVVLDTNAPYSRLRPRVRGIKKLADNQEITLSFQLTGTCSDGNLATQTVTHTVKPITASDAGEDLPVNCPGDIISLNADTEGNENEEGNWYILGKDKNGISFADEDQTGTNAQLQFASGHFGTSTLQWSLLNDNGCATSDEIEVTNLGAEDPVSIHESDTIAVSHCYVTTTHIHIDHSIGGDSTGGQYGQWIVLSGPNEPNFKYSNDNKDRTRVSGLTEGTYNLIWDVSGPCANGRDTVTVVVPEPTQDVTPVVHNAHRHYCDGRTKITLKGPTPQFAGETVQWSVVEGNGVTIHNPNSPTTVISGLDGSSDYKFYYEITSPLSSSCSQGRYYNIEYLEPPQVNFSDGDFLRLSCYENEAVIDYTKSGGDYLTWRIIDAPHDSLETDYTDKNLKDNKLTIKNLNIPGQYTVRMRLESYHSYQCPVEYSDIVVEVAKASEGANAGSDQLYIECGTETVELVGNDPTAGYLPNETGMWSVVQKPTIATPTFEDPSKYNSNINVDANGEYRLKWIVSAGNQCPPREDTTRLVISDDQVEGTPLANLGEDTLDICHGSHYTMDATKPKNDERGAWTVSSEPAGADESITFADTTDPKTDVWGFADNTKYEFVWSVEPSCSTAPDGNTKTDTLVLNTTDVLGPVEADAGEDKCLAGETTTVTLTGNDPDIDNPDAEGEWTKVSGPSATIVSPSTQSTEVNSMSPGNYVFRWEISVPSCTNSRSDEIMITISDPTSSANTSDTPEQVCIDGTGSTSLKANAPAVGTGKWSQTTGPGGAVIAEPTANNTSVSGLKPAAYGFTWTITNGACQTQTDEASIEVAAKPTSPTADAATSVCGNSVTLSGNAVENGNAIWSLQGDAPNDPTIADETASVTTVSGLITGTYTFRRTAYGNSFCPSTPEYDEVVVEVSKEAAASADASSICLAPGKTSTSTNLRGNPATEGSWTLVSKSASAPASTLTPTSANGNIAIVEGLGQDDDGTGTYTYRYTLDDPGGCDEPGQGNDEVTISVNGFGDEPTAGANQTLCEQSPIQLDANTISTGDAQWSKLSGPSGTFNDNTLKNAEFTPSDGIDGTYVFEWNVNNNGCEFRDQVIVKNYEAPVQATAGSDETVCPPGITLNGNTPENGVGNWSVSDKPGANSPTFSSYIDPNATATVNDAGDYTLRWTISNKDEDGEGCADTHESVNIYIPNPAPTTADAGNDQEICPPNSETILDGNTPSTGDPSWSIAGENNTVNLNAAGEDATVTNLTAGNTYTFEYTISSKSNDPGNACISRDSTEVLVHNETTTAHAGSDVAYCYYDYITLNGNSPENWETGTWSTSEPNTFFLDKHDPNTAVAGDFGAGTYDYTWSISNENCPSSEDNVTVDVKEDVNIANAGVNQTVTAGSATMDANAAAGEDATGTWTTASRPSGAADPSFADANNSVTEVSGLVPGSYTFTWTISNGGCSSQDNMDITVLPEVEVAVSQPEVTEEGSNTLEYTFTADGAVPDDYTINFDVSGEAELTRDYQTSVANSFESANGTIVMSGRSKSETITVNTVDDDKIENDEDVSLTLVSTTEYAIGSNSSATGTITDEENPVLKLSASDGEEGVSDVEYTVTAKNGSGDVLTNATGSSITADVSYTVNTAAETDFDEPLSTQTVEILDGNSSGTDILEVKDDARIEVTEDVEASLSNSNAHADVNNLTEDNTPVTANILDNDQPTFAFSKTQDGEEGQTDVSYTISMTDGNSNPLTNKTGQAFTVNLSYSGATAADFSTGSLPGTFDIPVDASEKDLSFTPITDTEIEREDLSVTIESVDDNQGITSSLGTKMATADITDDGKMQISRTQHGAENNDGSTTPVKYEAKMVNSDGDDVTNETGGDMTATVSFSSSDASDADFESNPLTNDVTATFGNAEASTTITIDVAKDDLIEGNEQLTATLSSDESDIPADGANDNDEAIADITDDDDDNVEMVLTHKQNGDEDGTVPVKFTVTLYDNNSGGSVLENATGSALTATLSYTGTTTAPVAAADFNPANLDDAAINIPDGETSVDMTKNVEDDLLIERVETIEAEITATGSLNEGNLGFDNTPVTATIEDNDDDVATVLVERIQHGVEGGADVKYTVKLTDGSGTDLTNATATPFTGDMTYSLSTGNDATDFTGDPFTSQTFSIADGNGTQTIAFDPVTDTEVERDVLTATISTTDAHDGIDPAIHSTKDNADANIDDDALIQIAKTQDGAESGNNVKFEIKLTSSDGTTVYTNATGSDISADLSYSGTTDASEDFTSTLPANTTSFTIVNGDNNTILDFSVYDDFLIENDETLIATLINAPNHISFNSSKDQATANITDNDDEATPLVEIEHSQDGEEGGQALEYRIYLNDGSNNSLTNKTGNSIDVSLSYSSDEATDADFTTSLPATVSIPNNENAYILTLNVDDDLLIEQDEDLTATIDAISSGEANTGAENQSATAAVFDDDDDNVHIRFTNASDGVEDPSSGNNTDAAFDVSLYDPNQGEILENQTGSKFTADIDYSGIQDADVNENLVDGKDETVEFYDGDKTLTVTLDALYDTDFEDEDVTATITAVDHAGTVPTAKSATHDSDVADIDDNAELAIVHTRDGKEDGEVKMQFTAVLGKEGEASTTTFDNTSGSAIEGTVGFTYDSDNVTVEDIDGSSTALENQTVTIASGAGNSSSLIELPVNNDNKVEGDETITATLSNPNLSGAFAIAPDPDDAASADIIDNDDDSNVTLIQITQVQDGSEDGTPVKFEVNLLDNNGDNLINKTGDPITVEFDFYSSSEAVQADFTSTVSQTVSIPDGNGAKIITLDVKDDLLIEEDETLEVELTNPNGAELQDSPEIASANVVDNDDDNVKIRIAKTQDAVEDGTSTENTDAEFELTLYDPDQTEVLKNKTGGSFDITIKFPGGTGEAKNDDFDTDITSAALTNLTIDNDASNTSFTLDAKYDTEFENEDITAEISAVNHATVNNLSKGSPSSATADIDDNAVLEIAKTDDGNEEGPVNADFTATLGNGTTTFTNNSGNAVEATISFAGSTAKAADVDGDLADRTISIADDNTSHEDVVEFTVVDDAITELDENIDAEIIEITSHKTEELAIGTNNTASATITDNDVSYLSVDDVTRAENASGGDNTTFSFTATLSGEVDHEINAEITTANDEAVSPDDFASKTATLNFDGTDGATATFDVTVDNEEVVEADETFSVTMSSISAGSREVQFSNKEGTGTIENDDDAAVTIDDASEYEDDGDITLSAVLNQDVQGGFEVDVSTGEGTAKTEDNDYDQVSGKTLTFTGNANETVTFNVSPNTDSKVEADETFTVSQSGYTGPSSGAMDISDEATVTIKNDDKALLSIDDVTRAENAGGSDNTTFSFTTTLSAAVDEEVNVDIETNDGSAVHGSDYTVNSPNLSFAANTNKTVAFDVEVTNEDRVEAEEHFSVSMTDVSANGRDVIIDDDNDIGIGTIENDDNATVTIADEQTQENNGQITATAKLDNPVDGSFKLDVSTSENTAIAGDDYTTAGETFTFTGNEGEEKSITIPVTVDKKLEDDETFIIEQSEPYDNALSSNISTDADPEMTILNDDKAAVTIEDANGYEDDGDINLSAVLNYPVQDGFKVDITSAGGSATEDNDYDALDTTLNFTGATAGEIRTFTASPIGDTKVEANETFTVSQSGYTGPSSGAMDISDKATVTINNDDQATVTLSDREVNEDVGEFDVVAELDHAVQGGFTLTLNSQDGSATIADNDYSEVSETDLVFTGKADETNTLTVTSQIDGVVEADETFTVHQTTISAPSTEQENSLSTTETAITLLNDDHAPQIADTTKTLSETLAKGTKIVDINEVEEHNDTDADGDNLYYSIESGANGDFVIDQASGIISVATGHAIDYETQDNYTLTLEVDDGYGNTNQATVDINITNADEDVNLSVADETVIEGDEGTTEMVFTIIASEQVANNLTVDYKTADSAATSDADYLAVSGQATIAAGSSSDTVSVTINGDELEENDETFTFTISNNSAGTITGAAATGTIEDDDHTPVANTDRDSTHREGAVTIDVLANDTDQDGDIKPASIKIIARPQTGAGVTVADGSITVDFSIVPEFTGNDKLMYEVTDAGGNSDTATVYLTVHSKNHTVNIPDSFSPNGDGRNDNFIIPGIKEHPNNELIIFNRWGNEVYRTQNYKNEWDGSTPNRNKKLPVGTYYYILHLKDSDKTKNGYIYLTR